MIISYSRSESPGNSSAACEIQHRFELLCIPCSRFSYISRSQNRGFGGQPHPESLYTRIFEFSWIHGRGSIFAPFSDSEDSDSEPDEP